MSADGMMMQIVLWLARLPWLLVVLGGAVLCVIHASRNPRASTLTGIALGIMVLSSLTSPFLVQMISMSIRQGASDLLRSGLISFVLSLPNALALALMLWAIFGSPSGMSRAELEAQFDEMNPPR